MSLCQEGHQAERGDLVQLWKSRKSVVEKQGKSSFFTYSIARRRRRLSGRHMYMFSRHRKLDF